MIPQLNSLVVNEIDRVMREVTEGARSGSSREVFVVDTEQPGTGRVAGARRFVGAAMIRAGERLRGSSQPEAAYSS
jgi:hypothetical protein